MPLNRKWRSMDLFGSHENLHPQRASEHQRRHHHRESKGSVTDLDKVDASSHHFSLKLPFRLRLSSIGGRDDPPPGSRLPPQYPQHHPPQQSAAPHHGGGGEGDPQQTGGGGGGNLVQRCVIIQKDERGYGFTVSGDNPVYVASVKTDGAAMRAGVQQGDRIVKVNGTLVTSRNHLEVVKLIKSGSYVALTLLGRPSGLTSGISPPSNIANPRDSTAGGRVTAPQPVDPDKDRELWQQKVHMTRAMYETAREDFERIQRQYVFKPSEKLHGQLLEKERTAKALENQLKQLTGGGDPASSPSNLVPLSNRFSDSEHGSGLEQSTLQTWASSLPATTSDMGSMSDSPHTSPSVSPTPNDPHNRHNGQDMDDVPQDIITNSDEDAHSEDEQLLSVKPLVGLGGRSTSPLFIAKITGPEANDPGPFVDIRQLEAKPAHMAIFLNFLISNSDPSLVLFHIISDSYSRVTGSTKELRKWAYEIYSTFIAQNSPLSISVEDNVISQIDTILMTGNQRTDQENILRTMFQSSRQSVQSEIAEQLADFRNKKDLGMGNFFGFQKLHNNMDRAAEVKAAEEVLIPHLVESAGPDDSKSSVSDRDQATAWALATFLRLLGGTKSSHSSTLDRVQTFMMKDKRSIKFPGSRSSRAKQMKGHQFTLQHFYVSTFCSFCGSLIWGVGYQGYQCQSCEMTVHKACVEEISEVCGGKQKKRSSKWIPAAPIRKPSSSSQQGSTYSAIDQLTALPGRPASTVMEGDANVATQPYPKDEDSDLAGLTTKGHSVKSIVSRYESTSPTGPGPNEKLKVPEQAGPGTNSATAMQGERRSSSDLSRSGSLNNKGEKSDRPARRAKSDVDVDSDTFKAINQSESSSASSLSKSSVESPSTSTDCVVPLDDSDLDVETGLPPLKKVLGEDVLRKLKPKEKKRQEVINELFYTERAHLRKLKIIDYLFNRPMLQERGVMMDLARALFPNMDEMILLHDSLVKDIKERSQAANPVVADVGDILLKRFDGDAGERFRKGCAEYCRNQAFALDALKKQQRKEPKLAQFLTDAHTNPLCQRLELKDLVPSQMQRLTKYPLLIESLLKYTTANSEEHKRLERAMERCRHILAYVNQAVKECENYHKLKDIQKKLDRKSVEGSNDPALADIKSLDLTQHKLIFDGPLTWKLRPHRTVDLHALLFDDMLVLLQKQDDKYVLKCQNTSMPSTSREEHKFTHSPVLRLQNLLARNLATEKKSFFVVNISESRAQMYEFIAATQELRIRWCKIINEKAEELKKSGNVTGGVAPLRTSSIIQPPQTEQVEVERVKVERERSASTPAKPLTPEGEDDEEGDDQVDRLGRLDSSTDIMPEEEEEEEEEGELIKPEQVIVSKTVTAESTPVRSPLATLSQGETTAPEMETNPPQQQGPAPASQPSTLTALHQSHQAGGLNVPVPMDQLKAMAQEMNTILNKLVAAMSSGSEERHRLRQELTEAQQKLDFLKDLQRQMTLSGAVPAGRLSPRPSDSSPPGPVQDIPDDILHTLSSTQEQVKQQNEQQLQVLKQQQQEEGQGAVVEGQEGVQAEPTSDLSTSANTTTSMEPPEQAPVPDAAARVVSSDEPSPEEKFVLASEEMPVEVTGQAEVHHGLQEATVTQLEESVEDLASHEVVAVETQTAVASGDSSQATSQGEFAGTASSTGVIEVVAEEEDDDDDDNNEVSVADLPLPDVGTIPAQSEDEVTTGQSMLDAVELEDSDGDSDTDNDTLTSRTSSQHEQGGLSTTVEDVIGERLEEGEGGEEEEDKRTLRGSVDDNENESGVKNSQVSISEVTPSIEAVKDGSDSLLGGGEPGTDTDQLRSSSVDPEGVVIPGNSKVEESGDDTTDPIQI